MVMLMWLGDNKLYDFRSSLMHLVSMRISISCLLPEPAKKIERQVIDGISQ